MRALPLLAMLCVSGWSSCSLVTTAPKPVPVNHYLADPRDMDTVRRVMVLPFHEAANVHAHKDQIREAFVNETMKLQRYEVVPLPGRASEHAQIYESLTRGSLSTDALVELSERYAIDGVLFGTITAYRPYAPIHLGLRVQLVSLHSGRTIWAAEGLYDAGDQAVLEDVKHYSKTFHQDEDTLHDWEINLMSPRKYAAFVAHRIVGSWRDAGL